MLQTCERVCWILDRSLSRWVGKDPSRGENDQRAVFVDEGTCIGCKNCNHCAAATFMMEEDYGRARVFQQWADSEDDINIAIESCPVDCIYWVDADLLPALEFVMQKVQRRNIAAMASGSARSQDPFQLAQGFINSGAEAAARLSAQVASVLFSVLYSNLCILRVYAFNPHVALPLSQFGTVENAVFSGRRRGSNGAKWRY